VVVKLRMLASANKSYQNIQDHQRVVKSRPSEIKLFHQEKKGYVQVVISIYSIPRWFSTPGHAMLCDNINSNPTSSFNLSAPIRSSHIQVLSLWRNPISALWPCISSSRISGT
jgi:hypothetical protein